MTLFHLSFSSEIMAVKGLIFSGTDTAATAQVRLWQ